MKYSTQYYITKHAAYIASTAQNILDGASMGQFAAGVQTEKGDPNSRVIGAGGGYMAGKMLEDAILKKQDPNKKTGFGERMARNGLRFGGAVAGTVLANKYMK